MKLVFISDLHLSPNTEPNNQLFYKLLRQWQDEIDALYILGDFFDYWLGDDDDNEFIRAMKQELINFIQYKPIYFIGGNHDFALGKHFAKETGVNIIKDCSVITVGGNTILLSHGDVFCTLDIAYQRMKKILRNPLLMAILLKTPLSWRYKLKANLEHKSSSSFNAKPREVYHVVDSSISAIANRYKATIVIHGHTHNPGCYTINSAQGGVVTRYEIPDWQDHSGGGYILLDDAGIQIVNA